MSEGFISRGFRGRRRQQAQDTHFPPGQYLVDGFPVLSAGSAPRTRKGRTLRTDGRLKMDELRLDGNAVGGILGEIFPFEMTTAQVTCANCGSLWRMGQAMVYGHDMGTIVRCASCDNALIRVGRAPGRYVLDMRGVRYLQVEEA